MAYFRVIAKENACQLKSQVGGHGCDTSFPIIRKALNAQLSSQVDKLIMKGERENGKQVLEAIFYFNRFTSRRAINFGSQKAFY